MQVKQEEIRTEMNEKINANTEELKEQKKTLDKVVKKVESLDKNKEEGNKTVFREIREREARADNLVIYQVPEPPSTLTRGGDKKKHDIEKVIEIFEFLECPMTNTGFKFIYRAGERKETDRPRPLIMCLYDPGARQYILANTRKLANSKFTNVSIVPDLTHQQRKEEEELRKEADTLNNALDDEEFLNWEWVLIGVRGKRTLVKRKKYHHQGEEVRRPSRFGVMDQRQPSTDYQDVNFQRPTVRTTIRGSVRGGRGGRGGGGRERETSRGGRRMELRQKDIVETETSQTQNPTVLDYQERRSVEGGGRGRREEEVEEEVGLEKTTTMKPRGVIPIDDNEEEEVVMEGVREVEEVEEETTVREGRKKRGRGDLSISPPQLNTKKKNQETLE